MAADFTWSPNYGATEDTTPRVLLSEFGDGYEERRQDGLNTLPRVWKLKFQDVDSVIAAIKTFIRGKGGVTKFSFNPPDGSALTYVVCRDPWTDERVNYNVSSLTLTFREVFEA